MTSESGQGHMIWMVRTFRILSSSSSDTGVKEDRVFLVGLGLVTEDSIDYCSVDLILRILS